MRGAKTRNYDCCNYSNSEAGHPCLQSACDTCNARLRSETPLRNFCCGKGVFNYRRQDGITRTQKGYL